MEVSASPKMFYYLSKRNKKFVEKMSHSRCLFFWRDYVWSLQRYLFVVCCPIISCVKGLFWRRHLFWLKEKFIFNMLPFHVFNHLFTRSRSNSSSDICLFCTRFNVKQKKASYYIYIKNCSYWFFSVVNYWRHCVNGQSLFFYSLPRCVC